MASCSTGTPRALTNLPGRRPDLYSQESALTNLPGRRPDLFSHYNPDLSGRKVAPRFTAPPPSGEPQQAPVVVRSEGTSVLVRELEKAHLRSKASSSHKRSSQQASAQRKQPRLGRQAHVEPQPDDEQLPQQQQQRGEAQLDQPQ